MQSINKNINNATTPAATTHVKVNFNNEFRRFALETLSFAHLQRTLRSLYSLDDSAVLKVKFQDDENDWVVLSSDEELSYAIAFGLPLRLTFQVVEGINAAPVTVSEPEFSPSPSPVPVSVPVRGGRGRGRGKAFAGAGVTVQDRLNAKSSRLTERIQALENRLDENPSLPSERQRVLRWRLVQLQNKLSAVQEKKASLDSAVGGTTPTPTPAPSDAPFNAEEPHPHCFGRGRMGRGRGCGRGGARGRGGLKHVAFISQSNHPDIIAARDAFAKLRQCKVDLKVARKSGSPQAIESCEAALKEAIQLKKECFGNILGSQRAQKRECAQNLKAAQRSGNQEQIKACEEALAQAITELKQAKAEILSY